MEFVPARVVWLEVKKLAGAAKGRAMSKAEYVNWRIPADFYQQSWSIARKYAKKYPDADSETVYTAATEAAELYERSEELRAHFKFRIWCWLRIRTALYIAEREEKMRGENLTDEKKAEIVRLRQEGLKQEKIAEKVGVCVASVCRVLKREKEKPETAKTAESGTKENYNKISVPHSAENVKPPEMDTVAMMKQLAAALRSEEVTEFCVTFTYSGEVYRVELRRAEE